MLPGVSVVAKHVGTGQTFERVTSAEGLYTVPLLPVGSYEMTFTLSGFQSRVVRGITLSVNDRIVIDAKLVVGGVTEVVEVVSTASTVQPTPALQTTVGSRQALVRQMVTENDRLWTVPRELMKGPERTAVDRLEQVKLPTLVLIGEKDRAQREQADLLGKRVPGAQVVVGPGGGHLLNLTSPAEFERAVLSFLR